MQEVKIYTRKFCGFCTAAKRLLAKKEVSFRELDATFDSSLKQRMIQESGGKVTFPQIFIGNTHVGGCDELYGLEQSGKLDKLLKG